MQFPILVGPVLISSSSCTSLCGNGWPRQPDRPMSIECDIIEAEAVCIPMPVEHRCLHLELTPFHLPFCSIKVNEYDAPKKSSSAPSPQSAELTLPPTSQICLPFALINWRHTSTSFIFTLDFQCLLRSIQDPS